MKKFILVIFAVLVVFSSKGQEGTITMTDMTTVKNIMTPSPNASSLGQYGEVPVSLFTGIPNINIPLFNINVGDFNLPIQLNYHASGVKVAETPSWVGMGWSLQAGGVITRCIQNKPDEDPTGWVNLPRTIFNQFMDEQVDATSLGSEEYWDLMDFTTDIYDSKPDIYYFNINGLSGKFIILPETHKAMSIPLTNNKIELEVANNNWQNPLSKITITTPEGIKYIFDVIEEIYSKSISYTRSETHNSEIGTYYDGNSSYWFPGMGGEYVSYDPYKPMAWYLSEIVFPDGKDPITFSYEDENYYMYGGRNVKYWSRVVEDLATYPYITYEDPNHNYVTHTELQKDIKGKRLSRIDWGNGHLDFIESQTPRNDLPSFEEIDMATYALDRIELHNKENKLIKTQQLIISNFQIASFNEDKGWGYKRIKLDGVQEIGRNGLKKPAHKFTYNESYFDGTDTQYLPPRWSPHTDFWGYFKNDSNDDPKWNDKPKIYIYPEYNIDEGFVNRDLLYENGIYSIFPRNSSAYQGEEVVTIDGSDRTANEDDMKLGILTQITYPTGGHTDFAYEAHQFKHKYKYITGGGLRIKSIKTYPASWETNNTPLIKEYTYNENENTSGRVSQIPSFCKFSYPAYKHWNGNPEVSTNQELETKYLTRWSSSLNGLGSHQGSHVGYTCVTERTPGNGARICYFDFPGEIGVIEDCDMGNNQYLFERHDLHETPYILNDQVGVWYPHEPVPGSNPPTYTVSKILKRDAYPNLTPPDFDWDRGQLLREEIYDDSWNLIKKTENNYSYSNGHYAIDRLYFMNAGLFNKGDVIWQLYRVHPKTHELIVVEEIEYTNWDIRWGLDYLPIAHKLLVTTKETDIKNNQEFERISSFGYNNWDFQINKISKTQSDGTSLIKKITYVGDLVPLPWAIPADANYVTKLYHKHCLYPLEEVIYEKVGSTETPISAQLFKYKEFNPGQFKLSELHKTEELNGLNIGFNVFESIHIDPDLSIDTYNKYKPIMYFDKYNSRGNLTEFHSEKGIHTSFIWDHKFMLPIASISGAKSNEVYIQQFEKKPIEYGWTPDYFDFDLHIATIPNTQTKGLYFPQGEYNEVQKEILASQINNDQRYEISIGGTCDLNGNSTPGMKVFIGTDVFEASLPKTGKWETASVIIDKSLYPSDNIKIKICSNIEAYGTAASADIYMDDLRMHPVDAQMTSATHLPLQGIRSKTDANGSPIYYNYDELDRLIQVRDHNRDIRTETQYNYRTPGEFLPSYYDFGVSQPGTIKTHTFVFKNNSTVPLTGEFKMGTGSTDFVMTSGETETTIQSGQTHSVTVQYTSNQDIRQTSTIQFLGEDYVDVAVVTGTQFEPPYFDPTAIMFGNPVSKAPPGAKELKLYSNQNCSVLVNLVDEDGVFTMSTETGEAWIDLEAGVPHTITVEFEADPNDPQPYHYGEIRVYSTNNMTFLSTAGIYAWEE
ncbi:MAG: hypothetical protein JEZ03_03290 [Bacteroidales bacterium]|nr:hypothetical protein [Bacteroidales bacterium]